MSLNDSLANVLSHIDNYEKLGKKEVITQNNSKLIRGVLEIMNKQGLIGGFEEVKETNGKKLTVNLLGTLNKCGVIKPRHRISVDDYKKFEKRYLPALDFGVIIISTNKGLMTHQEAKKQNLGGTLISYAY